MRIEVLVAAYERNAYELPGKLNLQSDAIIGNQGMENKIEEIDYNGHKVRLFQFQEKGVGLNRNNSLMRATADVCLFADDDMRYVDGYPKLLEEAFKRHPDADVIVFNLVEKEKKRYVITKDFRVRWHNFMRFGAVRIAAKLSKVRMNGISFHLCFGGGTEYSHGEDTLFLADCLRAGMKIYAVPVEIAELTEERESSWFKGYTEKYFHDKGVLYYCMSKRWYHFLCFQDAFRHKRTFKEAGSWMKNYKKMIQGVKQMKDNL